jgi:hypothetical protein
MQQFDIFKVCSNFSSHPLNKTEKDHHSIFNLAIVWIIIVRRQN